MAVRVHEDIAGLRASVADRRTRGPVGFVPTMGALHAGHASLVARARRECETVVVSIFVNPLQFDRAEDLARYPRPLADDVALCERLGVDLVFAPAPDVMYPGQPQCTISVGQIADHLCGAFRPGHFAGVATVVVKLLNIVQPDVAYFGEKDAQQLAIVRRAVADLDVPVTIASVETVREPDGLAISSRNRLLSSDERRLAPLLYQALRAVRDQVAEGTTDASLALARAAATIPDDGRLRLEYLELVDPASFQPIGHITGPVIAAGALWVGSTRLIDNLLCQPDHFKKPRYSDHDEATARR